MKKIIFFCFLFLASCSQNVSTNSLNNDLNFYENNSFEQIKIYLDNYSKNSSFPNINE